MHTIPAGFAFIVIHCLRKFIFFTNEVSGFWYGDDHPPGADDFLIVGADLPRMEERQRWVTS